MTDAPKRIWMDETSEDGLGMFVVSKTDDYANMDIEYTRKDISDELAEALKVARATNASLHRRVQATEGPLQGKIEFLEWYTDHLERERARKGKDVRAEYFERKLELLEISKSLAVYAFGFGGLVGFMFGLVAQYFI